MLESLIYLIVYIAVLGLVLWLLIYVVEQLPMPPPFARVAKMVIVVIGCIILIYLLLGLVGGAPPLRLR